jgi:hypothetical protein
VPRSAPDGRIPTRRTLLGGALAGAAAAALPASARALTEKEPPAVPLTERAEHVDYHAWSDGPGWRGGTAEGVRVTADGLVVGHPAGTAPYRDPHTGTTRSWEYAVWTSPAHRLPFGATQAVASWNAETPAGSWIEVLFQGSYGGGSLTPWYVMGRWASGDGDILRTSVDGQRDAHSGIATDTFAITSPATDPVRLTAYRLRVVLHRRPGSAVTPRVRRLGTMASALPDRFAVPASTPGGARGVELRLPRYSQELHKGEYPQYNGGGEAWCSPTSSQMVVEYWGRRPSRAELAWVNPSYPDPAVCQAARATYDHQYQGCGNWPFNAAYAASYGLDAAITRLRSLHDVERLIQAGIPVITSQSFLAAELDGAGYGTAGHLMVVAGFTRDGDVVAHDPAAPTDQAVRRVYRRHQFETIWLRTRRHRADGTVADGSGGVAYLYWPPDATAEQRRALASVGVR